MHPPDASSPALRRFCVDFHHHVGTDPLDPLDYSVDELVDAALTHGMHALAVTPHCEVFSDPGAVSRAAAKGLLLIPGVEKMVEGREVLVLNVEPRDIPEHCSFDDIRHLREVKGGEVLVVAPHPFFPRKTCLQEKLVQNADCFDAVELSHFYGFGVDHNRPALEWAKATGTTVLATSDTHDLSMLGYNYSVLQAEELTAISLFDAVRKDRCEVVTQPYTVSRLARFVFGVLGPITLKKMFLRRRG